MRLLSQQHISNLKVIGNAAAIVLAAAAVYRWCHLVESFSVNLLVWDQWDLYDAFFEPHSWVELFRWQHGPHRQGVGFFLTKIVAALSGWNTRVESFAIGGVIVLAMVVAIILKKRLTASLQWSDATIAVIFLTPLQWSIFASVPNPSHGAVPLLMMMGYCIGWTLRHPWARFATVLILNFLLIYTGFGLVVGIITPVLLTVELLTSLKHRHRQYRWGLLVAIVISLIGAASFFVGYRFMPAAPGFQFPIAAHWQYPAFVVLMLANFWGVKGVGVASFVAGTATLMVMLALCTHHIGHWTREGATGKTANNSSAIDSVVVVLIAATLLFCILSAIGRVALGLNTAQASRYVTYLIPGFFGAYLHFVSRPPKKTKPIFLTAFLIGLIAATVPLRSADVQTMSWLKQSKIRWKENYLQTGNVEESNRRTHFMIYPDSERTRLDRKLAYMKARGLNLFQDIEGQESSVASEP